MFKTIKCPNCGQAFDEYASQCPNCQSDNDGKSKSKVRRMHFVASLKQLLLFLAGWGGLKIIALLVRSIIEMIGKSVYQGDADSLSDFLNSNKVGMIINSLAYVIIFVGLLAILWNDIFPLAKEFKKIRPFIYGIGYGLLITAVTIGYTLLLKACGIEFSDNGNESAISTYMIAYPTLSVLIFVILGPIVEELVYRVGLFAFLYRINKYLAYVVAALVFGLIHMSFNFSDINVFLNELINIPSYIFAGVVLCYIYSKEGFACSTYAHITNNLVAFIATLVSHYAGASR
ncbi:MAG: CPBP family intramembrane glutamic endopeptidase [Bacilli bacterium]|jgi:membrane protease YdiL (CAAX protease family)